MELLAFHQISLDRYPSRRRLPLRFRRQALARPVRKRIRLEIADVAHRRCQQIPQRHQPAQRENLPAPAFAATPIERRFPALAPHCIPTFRQPQLRVRVPAVLHELQILRTIHRPRRQPERLQINFVPRRFVVETKFLSAVPNLRHAASEIHPAHARGLPCATANRIGSLGINRVQRIIPERILHIRDQQLLMLLFVIQSQDDPCPRVVRKITSGHIARGKILHRRIHVMPVRQDLIRRRPRKRSTQLLLRLRRNRVVVAVEEPDKVRMKRPVSRHKFPQHKRLKKPGCVRQVPFGWTGVRRGLHHHVLWGQRRAERKAPAPHATKFLCECCCSKYAHWPVLMWNFPAEETRQRAGDARQSTTPGVGIETRMRKVLFAVHFPARFDSHS
jgi:hypothetical protein